MSPGNESENTKLAKYLIEASQNALNIISDVLDFTKNTAIQKDKVNLNEWLENGLTQIKRGDGFDKLDVTISCEDKLDVAMDAKKMDRVVINLLNNASEALYESKTENPEIIINCEERAKDVVIKISDNGPGIPDDIKIKLFDAFVTKNKVNGTGIRASHCEANC